MDANVPAFCECGCGQLTDLAENTKNDRGWIKGQPKRFIHGHNARGNKIRLGAKQPESFSLYWSERWKGEGNPRWSGGVGPEERRQYSREYRKLHPEKRSEFEARRRARIHATQIEPVDYLIIAERDRDICYLCTKVVAREDRSFDHVIPLSKGGTHMYNNIKLTHLVCNVKKGDKLWIAE